MRKLALLAFLLLPLTALLSLGALFSLAARAAEPNLRLELNALETAENRCRMTFVIENKHPNAVETFKIDLALFNPEGTVYRRMVIDIAPMRPAKTIVKTFATDGDCGQLSSLLVNEVSACTPGDPATCIDDLALSSRVKAVKLYK